MKKTAQVVTFAYAEHGSHEHDVSNFHHVFYSSLLILDRHHGDRGKALFA